MTAAFTLAAWTPRRLRAVKRVGYLGFLLTADIGVQDDARRQSSARSTQGFDFRWQRRFSDPTLRASPPHATAQRRLTSAEALSSAPSYDGVTIGRGVTPCRPAGAPAPWRRAG